MVTYQYFHCPYEHFDVMFLYASDPFIGCVLDIREIEVFIIKSIYLPSVVQISCMSCITKVM